VSVCVCVYGAGQMLFLPAGWFHEVPDAQCADDDYKSSGFHKCTKFHKCTI